MSVVSAPSSGAGVLERLAAGREPGVDAVAGDASRWTHAELLARVEAASCVLAARGIGPRSVVGLTIADEAAHLVATLALLVRGAGQIVLATHDAPALRDAVARRVGVNAALTDADAAGFLAADAGTARDAGPTPADRTDAARVFLKTSGTTGDVNLVAYTLADLVAQSERHADYRGERLLRLAAIEHNNSKRHRLYAVLQGGCNVFAAPRPGVVEAVERHRVSCLDVSRLHAADLAAAGRPLPAGTKLRTGGSAIPRALRRALLERVTPLLHVRYAATECGGIAMAGPDDHGAEPELAGAPLAGVRLRVVDDAGRPVEPGGVGRIQVRAAGMATAYLDHAAQTAARFVDGWFVPGDVGELRADGRLVVRGRADDMIILNGLNVFPAEIERVLEQHPAVAEAAAFALASRVHGQIPLAAVSVRAEGGAVSAGELQAFARERLGLRAPRRVLVLESLPRNAAGKVSRLALQSLAAPGGAPP